MNIRLAIIIPVYNRKVYTASIIEQLMAQSYLDFNIIIVDDGSNDGTADLLAKFSSQIDVIRGDGSWWWAKSVNQGVELAMNKSFTHILLMNDDIFIETHYIEKAIQQIDKEPNAIIGSISVTNDSIPKIFFAGCAKIINWKAKAMLYQPQFSIYSTHLTGMHTSIILPGRGLIIPLEIVNQIGLFDNRRLPQYLADFDFVRRANDSGFKTLISYDLVVRCEINATGKGATYGNQSFTSFVRSFFNRYSHHSLVSNFHYLSKHCKWWEFPSAFIIDKCRVFYAFFKRKRVDYET